MHFLYFRSTFIYRRPKTTESSYEIFLRPLSEQVWYCLIFSITIFLIAMRIIVDTEHVLFNELRDIFERTWSNSLLFVVAAFCQQGFDLQSRLISGRIVAFFILLLSLLVYQFYSASIVSYLLRDPPRAIKTIDDLRKSSLRAGIEDILIDRAFVAVNN